MAGSTYGKRFRMTTWGETHGKGVGVVVDGCPAGLTLTEEEIQRFLDRRKPGQSEFTTMRKEGDEVTILSGVFEGKTTGSPISMIVYNQDQHSKDYSNIKDLFRPGHADYTFDAKYGFRDYRGGGRSSGRETIGRVAAGAIASKILSECGVTIHTYTKSIGPIAVDASRMDYNEIYKNKLYMPDSVAAGQATEYIRKMKEQLDSVGGVVECVVDGFPAGAGEPVFDKLDAELAKALMSIGAVKGVEVGDGFSVAEKLGSQNNDAFIMNNGVCEKVTNHSGGVLGGISDGSQIILRAAFKPTPSIAQPQNTVTRDGENTEVVIHGRHDPVIVPRAVVVVESMVAVTLLDALMESTTSTMDKLKKFC
ncbi:MAG: chorismate synthase [Lachnospiraceae bacterium]